MLQAPYFDVNSPLAVNYGAIGAVIGHELSHAFDDQGSQFDENGNLHNWWTEDDKKRFNEKTAQLIRQYDAYSPLPSYYVNGQLTLGENIADNSGFAIAFKAYHLALNGSTSPMINNFNGDQIFYISFAQMWRYKARDLQIIQSLQTNVHSPTIFRTNGVLSNQDFLREEMRTNKNISNGIGLFISLFLFMSMANAVRYAGSCEFDVAQHPLNAQEVKSELKAFLWVYDQTWAPERMHTTLGDTDAYDLDDNHDLDHLVIGAHIIAATALNPIITLTRDEGTNKAQLSIDSGGGNVITKYGDDCKHWTCQANTNHLCADPNP